MPKTPFFKEKIEKIGVLPVRREYQPDRTSDVAFLERLYAASGLEFSKGAAAQMWLRAKNDNDLPDAVLRGLCLMYLGLTPEMLTTNSRKRFAELLRPRTSAVEVWSKAVEHYSSAREELTKLIRPYYANMIDNQERDFPLLVRPGWLLSAPLRLDSATEKKMLTFDETATLPVSPLMPGLAEKYHDFRQWFDRDITMFNGDSYRPLKIEPVGNSLRLTFGLCGYFDYYDTCEIFGPELAHWSLKYGGAAPRPNGIDLPLRGSAAKAFDLTNRSAVAGVTTLTIIRNYKDKGDCFLRHERGKKVAVNQGRDSLVPAGTFQPFVKMNGAHSRDFFIRRTVLREFAEELLGLDEFTHLAEEVVEAGAERLLKPFGRLIDAGKAHIFLLGVGLDPVSTIPELLTAFVFDYKELNLLTSCSGFLDNWEGKYHVVPLSEGSLHRFGHQEKVFSASAACARLAARNYPHLLMPSRQAPVRRAG